ncbi:hypothetical protein LIER_26518 [Lithospermum erythrorhizon]|uniref:RNase H type-1 domain-containing protein n=1 Tax=Lithospermum erythrorhizon TaxID=34254 RepID=A0AAV3R8N1_LITER
MNLALLAKQGWRLINGEASLLYKILNGHYFKIRAKLESNPSFGWRSILEGRKVLMEGVRWRVGDGKRIDVWKDPWVPRPGNFRLFGGGNRGVRMVSQLITNGGLVWTSFREWWLATITLLGKQDQQELIPLLHALYGNLGSIGMISFSMRKGANFIIYGEQAFGWLGSTRKHGGNRQGNRFENHKGRPWGSEVAAVSYSSLIAKSLTMRMGLEFAWKNNWRRVIMESDCKKLVQCLNNEHRTPNELQLIIADTTYLPCHMEVQFQHTSRVSNNVAHSVAHWDYGGLMEMHWLHYPPRWLSTALDEDIS